MEIEYLENIVKMLKDNGVTEFELKEGSTVIKLSRGSARVVTAGPELVVTTDPAAPHATGGVPQPVATTPPVVIAEEEGSGVKVESPIVGTFYRQPSPDAEPFVEVGDSVKKGQTLCIIEAMKLMNEIDAPCSGKIAKICLTDGQVVEFGEVLFVIEP